MENIEQPVIDYLKRALTSGQNIASETPLLASGLLDSMALTQLIAFIEQRFGVKVPDDALEASNFRTPALITQLVSRLTSGGVSSSG